MERRPRTRDLHRVLFEVEAVNAHKSRARKRRLAHARGLRERFFKHPCGTSLAVETQMALRRAGWNYRECITTFGWLAYRGFPPRV